MSRSKTRSRTTVTYKDVSKQYGEGDESVLAIDDVSLGISQGEFVSFVGPSGCGKTTILHLTAGLIEPTDGLITVDEQDVTSPAYEKHQVGLVFQQPVLLDWRTVLKNVLLPVEIMVENGVLNEDLDHFKRNAERLIELVGLEGFEDAYPQELSGGMQQRAAICRSLLYDPPVLLMDEPFGALDAMTRDEMNEELLRIWGETDKTVLFVTHNLEEAVFLSDRVVVISPRPGRVLDVVDIDIPRPRDDDTRTEDRYHKLVSELYTHFKRS